MFGFVMKKQVINLALLGWFCIQINYLYAPLTLSLEQLDVAEQMITETSNLLKRIQDKHPDNKELQIYCDVKLEFLTMAIWCIETEKSMVSEQQHIRSDIGGQLLLFSITCQSLLTKLKEVIGDFQLKDLRKSMGGISKDLGLWLKFYALDLSDRIQSIKWNLSVEDCCEDFVGAATHSVLPGQQDWLKEWLNTD